MNKEPVNLGNKAFKNEHLGIDLIVKSEFLTYSTIIKESYCSNSNCDCRDVTLVFYEYEGEEKVGKKLFSIRLHLDSLEIIDKVQYEMSVKAEDIINEFMKDMIPVLINRFNEKYNIAKGIEPEEVLKPISEFTREQTLVGNCVTYKDVFDYCDLITFLSDDKVMYIEDQYCMNHKCLCDEVFLRFVKIDNDGDVLEDKFVIRYSLKSRKYAFEFNNCTDEETKNILRDFKEDEKEILDILKKRYKKMKAVGKDVLTGKDGSIKAQVETVKVGRNDDCPCGSGKKYKKCCGR